MERRGRAASQSQTNMKLRITGNSLRLRLNRTDVATLINIGRLEETIHFTTDERSKLTYGLEHKQSSTRTTLRYQAPEVVITLATNDVTMWVESDQVGIYSKLDLGPHGILDLSIEKDFACLDGIEADNTDTFTNPNNRAVC
jgi:tRNA threonylcarbamoyladenosine modification (KEOPS) complex  Pcc1 subunit